MRHAPRERVSWNRPRCSAGNHQVVTLHVSVWVEMCHRRNSSIQTHVTLHVSVWVEIVKTIYVRYNTKSRSTWACELKFFIVGNETDENGSRSTWACELKCHKSHPFNICFRHAPRERVSWNSILPMLESTATGRRHAPRERVSWNLPSKLSKQPCKVTLHVSVWVEITNKFLKLQRCNSHAPRERVSWNSTSDEIIW